MVENQKRNDGTCLQATNECTRWTKLKTKMQKRNEQEVTVSKNVCFLRMQISPFWHRISRLKFSSRWFSFIEMTNDVLMRFTFTWKRWYSTNAAKQMNSKVNRVSKKFIFQWNQTNNRWNIISPLQNTWPRQQNIA